MMNLAEYRRTATRLSDYLPWAALVAEGVVLNKDGSFQRTARFRGPDLDSAVAAELVAVAGRLNNAFRRLGSGWAIFVEAQRHEASTYPSSLFPDAAAALLDAERKADFEETGAHYISGYYLTVTYLPPAEDAARTEAWLYEGRERGGIDPGEILNTFIDRTDRVLALLDGFMPECAWLDSSETLTYLHSTVSTKRHRVRVPETPIYLDALLADQPLTGGLEPRLGTVHLRILTIVGFPTATTPGILDDLNRLAFPYRWSTRAILLDKTDATKLLTKIRRQWFAKRKSIAAILKEVMTNEASALVDTDASNKAADADVALQELGADFAGQAYVTATVAVWDDDPRIADEKLRLVEKVIQGRDFTALVENIARRNPRPIDLMKEIGALRSRGYTDAEIAEKIGVGASWVNMIASLLERGEERLVAAVETGLVPITLAMEISKAESEEAQNLLLDAYETGKLRGKKLAAVRRLLEMRMQSQRRGSLPSGRLGRKASSRRMTAADLMQVYQREAEKQRLLVKKSNFTQTRLLFVVEALKDLLADDGFVNLLRAEGLATMPRALKVRVSGDEHA